MNNNHIYAWAKKSGINFHVYKCEGLPASIDDEFIRMLKKFAEYSAKYERQLCAKICERQAQDEHESQVWTDCAQFLANRIKARGQA